MSVLRLSRVFRLWDCVSFPRFVCVLRVCVVDNNREDTQIIKRQLCVCVLVRAVAWPKRCD